MKKAIIILVSAIVAAISLLSSCTGGSFSLEGTVDQSLSSIPYPVVEIYEEGLEGEGALVKSIFVKDGNFSYKGKADLYKLYNVILRSSDSSYGGDEYSVSFVPEAGDVVVVFNADMPVVTAGDVTEAYNQMEDAIVESYNGRLDALQEAYESDDMDTAAAIEKSIVQDMLSIYNLAFEANTDNVVGLMSLVSILTSGIDMSLEEVDGLYQKASRTIQKNEIVQAIVNSLKATQMTAAGNMYVDIAGKDSASKTVKLSDFVGKGKYVLVDFWASWCGPCMQAIPNLRSLSEKYADKGLVLVGVNSWEQHEGDGQKCAQDKNMTWPVIFVSDDSATEAYGIQAIPTLILFAPDGTILERMSGEQGLAEAIAKYLGE